MGVACPEFRGENFCGWLKYHEIHESFLPRKFPIIRYWLLKSTVTGNVELHWTTLDQEYIIEKEGEYPTSLWACVTTLYGGHDLCNDIHIHSGFTDCPTTSHTQPALVLYSTRGLATCPQTASTAASSLWISLQRSWPP